MSTLKDALDAAAKAAYGEGWDQLSAMEQHIVRERTLPVVNAVLVHVREGIAQQLDYRAERQAENQNVGASKQLVYAARAARAWPS